MNRIWMWIGAILALAASLFAPVPAAAHDGLVRTEWGTAEDPGAPYYARIAAHEIFEDDGLVAIAFYREPECVPQHFNLLGFFDGSGAFVGCPLTGDGVSLWEGAPLVGAPKVVRFRGAGSVPVWFVPVDAVDAAAADGVLTIAELATADGLVTGAAEHFTEVLHPGPLPPFLGGGGHPNPKISITAHGDTEDGRRFALTIVGTGATESTQIRFR